MKQQRWVRKLTASVNTSSPAYVQVTQPVLSQAGCEPRSARRAPIKHGSAKRAIRATTHATTKARIAASSGCPHASPICAFNGARPRSPHVVGDVHALGDT
jgi:hypothetical protein